MAERSDDLILDLMNHGSSAAAVGGVLLTTSEVDIERVAEYNRWYEDDHFISGGMALPWVFSGRRWFSTRRLADQRVQTAPPVISDVAIPVFLHTYLIAEGHVADVEECAARSVERLSAEGRMWDPTARRHVYTFFHDLVGVAYRDSSGPRDIHALDYPFGSIVMEIIDASPGHREALTDWILTAHAPGVLDDGPAICLAITPRPYPDHYPRAILSSLPPVDSSRVVLLWLCDIDADKAVPAYFANETGRVDASGLGSLRFLQAFEPTLPGTEIDLARL